MCVHYVCMLCLFVVVSEYGFVFVYASACVSVCGVAFVCVVACVRTLAIVLQLYL